MGSWELPEGYRSLLTLLFLLANTPASKWRDSRTSRQIDYFLSSGASHSTKPVPEYNTSPIRVYVFEGMNKVI